MEQVQQITAKETQRYIAHYGRQAHVRIIGIEWVRPKDFDQYVFPYGRYQLLDHKEDWSWMVKFLIYDGATEQKPYTSAETIRVLDDGSIGAMEGYPVF